MYLDSTSIILLSIALLIIIALVTMEIVSARSNYADQKSKYTSLRKHYGKIYNMIHDEDQRTHKYYSVELQFLNQDDGDSAACNTKWYLTEYDMLEAIKKHNEIAYQIRNKLDKLKLDHSNKHMFDRHGKEWGANLDESKEDQHARYDRHTNERLNWYIETDKIAKELSIKVSSYAYNELPYPINIKDIQDTSGNWWNTKTVDVSKQGVQKLLNDIAY